jgi:hypothetical protein
MRVRKLLLSAAGVALLGSIAGTANAAPAVGGLYGSKLALSGQSIVDKAYYPYRHRGYRAYYAPRYYQGYGTGYYPYTYDYYYSAPYYGGGYGYYYGGGRPFVRRGFVGHRRHW